MESQQILVVNAKTMSRTNLSEEPIDKKDKNFNVENTAGTAMTPKHEFKNNKIEPYVDFHYEKLNEQDENDLDFDDLIRQH